MTLDQLVSRIAPLVPGCPFPTIEQAVHDAAQAFCDRTRVLAKEFSVPVTAGVSEYDVTPDGYTVSVDFDNVTLDGVRLHPVPPSGIHDPKTTDWYEATGDGIRLVKTPTKDATLRGVLVMAPVPGESFHPKLYLWREAIQFGALYRLMNIPGQSWSNQAAGTTNWHMYSEEVRRAEKASVLRTGKRTLRVSLSN